MYAEWCAALSIMMRRDTGISYQVQGYHYSVMNCGLKVSHALACAHPSPNGLGTRCANTSCQHVSDEGCPAGVASKEVGIL